jgi:hypothetical protein
MGCAPQFRYYAENKLNDDIVVKYVTMDNVESSVRLDSNTSAMVWLTTQVSNKTIDNEMRANRFKEFLKELYIYTAAGNLLYDIHNIDNLNVRKTSNNLVFMFYLEIE